MGREWVKDFYGRILGGLEDQGDRIVATDFYGRILGYYVKSQDVTTDFYGRRLCTGDGTVGLIMSNKDEE